MRIYLNFFINLFVQNLIELKTIFIFLLIEMFLKKIFSIKFGVAKPRSLLKAIEK